ncbi:PilT/PilU family type 4a pilus ATPase [Motiliproteus coralliicola]|uniref:PilT/PilU family type 4a pilus ATPase n=1 Tax=Motiliproteus coralliicola TaxID=2283196 RepID=A0A369WWK8_9GAMM|nr:PilT/PilU family type 4a pilus ATPase [Motiliproteus coralliicola]RDE24926.1 PilT/PilU family type 4a pilus ATPase [Motiliproteus coralliicola]
MSDELYRYLEIMVDREGADLFLSTNAKPSSKIHGKLLPIADKVMARGEIKEIAYAIMSQDQIDEFEQRPEMNLALSKPGLGRFRVNIFRQRHEYSMVIRSISTDIPDINKLGLPQVLPKLIMEKRGLILFVGGTGSGKSTSLASLIDHRNSNSAGHIITIEDPVEFIHHHKKSIINQREVGVDTLSYQDALENTLRQAPDVILIGEIRSAETMEHALAFAETGHLCLSTLHANNANQALGRIINFFPEERHKQLLLDISLNMKGIISQRLLPTNDGKRAAAIEVLLGSPRIAELIKNGHIDDIKEVMEKSAASGMQTFDMALFNLWKAGRISAEEALRNADSKNNLALKMRLVTKGKANAKQSDQPASGNESESKSSTKSAGGFSLELEPGHEEESDPLDDNPFSKP